MFKLYVRDRASGEVFREPLRLEVFRKRAFGAAESIAQPFEIRHGPEKNDYKFFLTFREAEAYELPTPGRCRMNVEDPKLALSSAIAAALLLFFPAAAAAHHFLGLPHYKYGEEYPQIPYMEVLAQVATTDLVFTHFPGFPKPGEPWKRACTLCMECGRT